MSTNESIRGRGWQRRALLAVALAALLAPAAHASWSVDPAHTEINFSVKHFFTPVTGSFESYEVVLDYDPTSPEKSYVEARIDVASVNTGNAKRDDHLRSADWFEADSHPHMTFRSTSVREVGNGRLVASGPLTIKGKTRQIELPITLLGSQPIPSEMRGMLGGSKEVASFEAGTAIDRADFGVGVGSWAATMVVGGEVRIEILLEAHDR